MLHYQSARWHRRVNSLSSCLQFLSPTATGGLAVNLGELRGHTDRYMGSRSHLSGAEKDTCLIKLVKSHPGHKAVAILACSHLLSGEAVQTLLLDELLPLIPAGLSPLDYLLVMSLTHEVRPDSMSTSEAAWLHCLIGLSSNDRQAATHLLFLPDLLATGDPSRLFLNQSIGAIPRRACERSEANLHYLHSKALWAEAHEASRWLVRACEHPDKVKQLFDRCHPSWRSWAAWLPDHKRLYRWQAIPTEYRCQLLDLLALEGPDFSAASSSSMLKGLLLHPQSRSKTMIYSGKLCISAGPGPSGDLEQLLNRVLGAFDKACETLPSVSGISFFIDICRTTIDEACVERLELYPEAGSPSTSRSLSQLLEAEDSGATIVALNGLIPGIRSNGNGLLRNNLEIHISKAIRDSFPAERRRFCEQISTGRAIQRTGKNIHTFGANLKQQEWLKQILDDDTNKLLENWPSKESVDVLLEMRSEMQGNSHPWLNNSIDNYLKALLAGEGAINLAERNMLDSLAQYWRNHQDKYGRKLALVISEQSEIAFEIRRETFSCLNKLSGEFVSEILSLLDQDTEMACVDFAGWLVYVDILKTPAARCFRAMLYQMMEKYETSLLPYTAEHLSVELWFPWLQKIRTLFSGAEGGSLRILDQEFLDFSYLLHKSHLPAIKWLESRTGIGPGMRWIFLGWQDAQNMVVFLELVAGSRGKDIQPVVKAMLSRITPGEQSMAEIYKLLLQIDRLSDVGTEFAVRLVKECNLFQKDLMEELLVAFLQDSNLSDDDSHTLRIVASNLGFTVYGVNEMVGSSLDTAAAHINREFREIVAEAERLESIRVALKRNDSRRTSELLQKHGIEDHWTSSDVLFHIPETLIDAIEVIGPKEFEISFPVTHLKPLQRVAMGLGDARMLYIRLRAGEGTETPRFCIHIHPDPHLEGAHGHNYLKVLQQEPPDSMCGGNHNRTLFQLNRVLWKHFQAGFASIGATHGVLSTALNHIAENCIICGKSLTGKSVWRSTTCGSGCDSVLERSSIEIRLSDLLLDPLVVDLLLSAVQATVTGPISDLLEGCPDSQKDRIVKTIRAFPALSLLQSATDLSKDLQRVGSKAEALLSWLCWSYRGFLVSATEMLKIPSMPGVQQFVLASASPEQEQAFSKHISANPSTQVVFHGTTIDRLYPILRNGLRIGSGTNLQRHGAAFGIGIYVACEPSMALQFSASSQNWPNSKLRNTRLLLGCELAGASIPATAGVHVVRDSSMIMVRYVFLFEARAAAPLARHVVPAMSSSFSMLRSRSA